MGLVLLRISIASQVIAYGLSLLSSPVASRPFAWSAGPLATLVGAAILIGFLTPLAGAASTIGYLALGFSRLVETDLIRQGDTSTALYLAVISLSLILLGPGAFSVDARLFGRREIILP